MTVANKTFGDFFDVVLESETSAGPLWMGDWKNLVDEAKWQKVRAAVLTDELVVCFAEDMVTAIRLRMEGICTDALYSMLFKEGKAFIREIAQKAQQFGVDVSAQVDVPLTPSDAIARAQGVEIQY